MNIELPYVELDCKFDIDGKTYEAGGAVVTANFIVAYPGKAGVLNNWHGKPLGTWKATSTWPTPRSGYSPTMSHIEAVVAGVTYTGRGAGVGMIFKGKRKLGK